MRRANGFSMIEMILVVAIVAILAAVATPSVIQMRQNALYRQSAFDLASMMREARARTVSLNREHRVEVNLVNPFRYRMMQGDRSSGSITWNTVVQDWTPAVPLPGVVFTQESGSCFAGPALNQVNVDFNTNGTAGIACTIGIRDATNVRRYQVQVTQNTGRVRIQ